VNNAGARAAATADSMIAGRQFLRADVGRFSLSGLTPAGDPVASVIHSNFDIYALPLDTHEQGRPGSPPPRPGFTVRGQPITYE